MTDIRRPTVIADLVEQGWAESARRVYRRLRTLTTLRLVVWIDAGGSVWIRGVGPVSSFEVPSGQWLATYSSDVQINDIEQDFLHHLRTMTGTNKRKAA